MVYETALKPAIESRFRLHFGVLTRGYRNPEMGRVKKGFWKLEGVLVIPEEGSDLGSRCGWKASQVSDVP